MTKQRVYLLITLLFVLIPCVAQGKKNELNKIVSESIKSVVKMHEDSVKKNIIRWVAGYNKYYILSDNLPIDYMLSDEYKNLGNKVVFFASVPFRKLKKGAICISCNSIALRNDTIEVRIAKKNLKATKELKNLNAKQESWHLLRTVFYHDWEYEYGFVYKYSCDTQKWELIDSPK